MKFDNLASIDKELDEIDSLLRKNKDVQKKHPESGGVKANYNTLNHVRHHLLIRREKLAKKMQFEEITVVLDGDVIKESRVPSFLLTNVLNKFQHLIIAIARSIRDVSDATGPTPAKIINEAMFDVEAFSPGSFKIKLSSHNFYENQSVLVPTLAKTAFDNFDMLIKCEDNPELIQEQWEKLHDRSIVRYKDFLGSIYRNDIGIKFYDKTNAETIRRNEISSELAKRVYDVIDEHEKRPPEEKNYIGSLVAVDLDRHTFGFIIKENEDRINGKFNEEIRNIVKNNLDKISNATFTRDRKYSKIKEKYIYTWILTGFES